MSNNPNGNNQNNTKPAHYYGHAIQMILPNDNKQKAKKGKKKNSKTAPILPTIIKNYKLHIKNHRLRTNSVIPQVIQALDCDGELSPKDTISIDDEIVQELTQNSQLRSSHLEITDKNEHVFSAILIERTDPNFKYHAHINLVPIIGYQAKIGNELITLKEAGEIIEEFKLNTITPDDLKNRLNDEIISLVSLPRAQKDPLKLGEKRKLLAEITKQAKNLHRSLNTLDRYNALHINFLPLYARVIPDNELQYILTSDCYDIFHEGYPKLLKDSPLLSEDEKVLEKKFLDQRDSLKKQIKDHSISDNELQININCLLYEYNTRALFCNAYQLIFDTLPRLLCLVNRSKKRLLYIREGNTSQQLTEKVFKKTYQIYEQLATKESTKKRTKHVGNYGAENNEQYAGDAYDFCQKVLALVCKKTSLKPYRPNTQGKYLHSGKIK